MGAGFSFGPFSDPEGAGKFVACFQVHNSITAKYGHDLLSDTERNHHKEFDEALEQYSRTAKGDLIRAQRMLHEFMEHQLLFGGINFDPVFTAFALCPVAAAVAIAVGQTCTAPLSRITILSQVEGRRRRSISEQAARIVEEQGGVGGYEGLWRGNWVSIAHQLTFYGINLLAYQNFRTLLMSSVPMDLGTVALVSGGLAAATATAISHPLDTLSARIAVQTSRNYEGAWRTFCNILKEDGFGSLYAGVSASLLGIVPSMAISLAVYDRLSMSLSKLSDSPFTVALVCGGIAGLAATTATFPINVVQRRMQTEGRKGRGGRRGIGQMVSEIVEKEGVRGLYRGIQPHCLKAVVGHATTFVAFDMVKNSSSFLGNEAYSLLHL